MICKECKSEGVKDFNGEIAIHLSKIEEDDKPVVFVFPKLAICLRCGFVEFVIPDEQREQLKNTP